MAETEALQKRIVELQGNLKSEKKAFGEREKEFTKELTTLRKAMEGLKKDKSFLEFKLTEANENYAILADIHSKCPEAKDMDIDNKKTECNHQTIDKELVKEVITLRAILKDNKRFLEHIDDLKEYVSKLEAEKKNDLSIKENTLKERKDFEAKLEHSKNEINIKNRFIEKLELSISDNSKEIVDLRKIIDELQDSIKNTYSREIQQLRKDIEQLQEENLSVIVSKRGIEEQLRHLNEINFSNCESISTQYKNSLNEASSLREKLTQNQNLQELLNQENEKLKKKGEEFDSIFAKLLTATEELETLKKSKKKLKSDLERISSEKTAIALQFDMLKNNATYDKKCVKCEKNKTKFKNQLDTMQKEKEKNELKYSEKLSKYKAKCSGSVFSSEFEKSNKELNKKLKLALQEIDILTNEKLKLITDNNTLEKELTQSTRRNTVLEEAKESSLSRPPPLQYPQIRFRNFTELDIHSDDDSILNYECILDIGTLSTLESSSWNMHFPKRILNTKQEYDSLTASIGEFSSVIGIIGDNSKGKTFILKKLCNLNIQSISTKGISIKSIKVAGKNLIYLDTYGYNNLFHPTINQEDNEEIEKNITKVVCNISDVVIVVVSDIKILEQRRILKLKRKYKDLRVIIVHNLKYIYSDTDISSNISRNLAIYNQGENGDPSANYFDDNGIYHLFFINDTCEYGRDYNKTSLNFLNFLVKNHGREKLNTNFFNEIYSYLIDPICYIRGKKKLVQVPMGTSYQTQERNYLYRAGEISVFKMRDNAESDIVLLQCKREEGLVHDYKALIYRPVVDTFQEENRFVILLELPGVDDINPVILDWKKDLFSISGEKINQFTEYGESKRSFGKFRKYFKVPEIFQRAFTHSMNNGLLYVEFAKD